MSFKIDKKNFYFKKYASMVLAASMIFGCVPVNVMAAEDIQNTLMDQQEEPQKGDIKSDAQYYDDQKIFLPTDGSGVKLFVEDKAVEVKEYDGEKWVLLDPSEYAGKGVEVKYQWEFNYRPIEGAVDKEYQAKEVGEYSCIATFYVNGIEKDTMALLYVVISETPATGTIRGTYGQPTDERVFALKDGHASLYVGDQLSYVEEFDGTKFVEIPESDYEKRGITVTYAWKKPSEFQVLGTEKTFDATEAGEYKVEKNIYLNGENVCSAQDVFYVFEIKDGGELKENEAKVVVTNENLEYKTLKFVAETGGKYNFKVNILKTNSAEPEENYVMAHLFDENMRKICSEEIIKGVGDFCGGEKNYEANLEAGKTYYVVVNAYDPAEIEVSNTTQLVPIKTKEAKLSSSEFVYTGLAMQPIVTIDGLKEGEDFTVSYKNNVNVGTATAVIEGKGVYVGSIEKTFVITKAAQNIKVSAASKTVKAKKVKKKAQVTSAVKVTGAKGKVSYKKVSGSSRLTINKNTGKITVKKKTKRGTYKIKVKVTAPTTENYTGAVKTVTVKVKVK